MITYPISLYKKLAQSTGVPEDDIKEAVFFFWRTGVLDAINNFEKPEVFIKGLGSFHVKEWVLKYQIPHVQDIVDNYPQHTKIEFLRNYVGLLKKVRLDFDKIKQDKKEFDERSRNIQEQKEDLGGTTEQTI